MSNCARTGQATAWVCPCALFDLERPRRCAECNGPLSMVDGTLCEVCRDAL